MQLMSTIINVQNGAKNQWLSSKWSLLIVLLYFAALQVDHAHDEKNTAALYEALWKMLEMLT